MNNRSHYDIIVMNYIVMEGKLPYKSERKGHMDAFRLYSTLPDNALPKTRAYIDTDALCKNYSILSSHVRAESICVVKADAYGHCCEICVPALCDAGCRRFAVSSLAEAVALRRILDTHGYDGMILILGYTDPADAPLLNRHRITQCVFSAEYARLLNESSDNVTDIHIKLNTGMNRLGFPAQREEDIKETASAVCAVSVMKNLRITGMFSHFARADELTPEGDAFTVSQFERFSSVNGELCRLGIAIPFLHICNSAGAVRFPQFALDGVRLGILLYGGGDEALCNDELSPVMKLQTVISHTHTIRAGESVGYGGTFTAARDMLTATMPVGYADGFVRAFKGACVSVTTSDGVFDVPLVGRICMDQCMADVTGTGAVPGDSVTLFGDRRGRLAQLAARAGTIDYECLCQISSRVPRIPINQRRRS